MTLIRASAASTKAGNCRVTRKVNTERWRMKTKSGTESLRQFASVKAFCCAARTFRQLVTSSYVSRGGGELDDIAKTKKRMMKIDKFYPVVGIQKLDI